MSTRERILDAAERLFAEKGFAATSVRAITAGAGVNLAALHYHFGSKDALIEEIFARRLRPINEERLALLELAEKNLTLEAVLEAYLGPPLRLMGDRARGGHRFLKLMGRAFSEPGNFFERRIAGLFSESFVRCHEMLQRLLPQLPGEEIFWRLHFVIGALAHTLTHTIGHVRAPEELRMGDDYMSVLTPVAAGPLDVSHVQRLLVAFLAGGFTAAATPVEAPAGRETQYQEEH